MTNLQAIDLLKGLEQSLDDYCELNDEGKTAFGMAITALEQFGNSEQLPYVQPDHTADIGKKVDGDCISRQAAIDAYGDWYVEEGTEEGFIGTVKQLLEGLPSVQPATNCSEIPNGSDGTISRQAAIDALTHEWDGMVTSAFDVIKSLPSAQPEIIRCKDCKYRYLDGMIWNCPFGLSGGEDFFCAYGAIGGGDLE